MSLVAGSLLCSAGGVEMSILLLPSPALCVLTLALPGSSWARLKLFDTGERQSDLGAVMGSTLSCGEAVLPIRGAEGDARMAGGALWKRVTVDRAADDVL